MPRYSWGKNGAFKFHAAKVDAQVAGQELERLAEKGQLTPEGIVNASKTKAAPLHNGFDWDNEKAGDRWRKEQARNLLRGLSVVSEEGDLKRAFFNVVDARGDRVYVTREKVTKVEDYRRQALRDAVRYLSQAQARLADLEGLEAETRAVVRVIKRVEKIQAQERAELPPTQ